MPDSSQEQVLSVFVYGTLKRGQCRETCWPCKPERIVRAWTQGELYDTGPYPALFEGHDLVAGELWTFDADSLTQVLIELDIVEEYRPGAEATNLYNRVIVPCIDQSGARARAYTYLYGRLDERRFFERVVPNYSWDQRFFAVWPPGADW